MTNSLNAEAHTDIQGSYLKPDIKQICKLVNNVTSLHTLVQKIAIFRKRYLSCSAFIARVLSKLISYHSLNYTVFIFNTVTINSYNH